MSTELNTETTHPRVATRPRTSMKKELHKAVTMLRVSNEVAGLDTLEEVLSTLIEFTTRETDSQRASLFLNDRKTGELYTRVAQGVHNRGIRILDTRGIAG